MLNKILRNDLGRTYLFTKGMFKCDTDVDYVNCIGVDALTQDRGDITEFYCPSRTKFGEYEVVEEVEGELSRLTTTLNSYVSRDEESLFYDLFKKNCDFDMHVHYGLCDSPLNFNAYDKALIFERVKVTSYSTDSLISLQPGDRAPVTETIDISVGNMYEVLPLRFSVSSFPAVAGNDYIPEVVYCGDAVCESICSGVKNGGCDVLFAVGSTNSLFFSFDGGLTWGIETIQAPGPINPSVSGIGSVACYSGNVVVLDYGSFPRIFWKSIEDIYNGDPVLWNTYEIQGSGGFNAEGLLNYNDEKLLVFGDEALIHTITTLGSGNATQVAPFTTVFAPYFYNGDYAGNTIVLVAVEGNIVASFDGGDTWAEITPPEVPSAINTELLDVVVKNENNWIVSARTNNGMYCTENRGRTWSAITLPASASRVLTVENFGSHVIYAQNLQNAYRSIDGGTTWVRISTAGSLNFGQFDRLVPCHNNPNRVAIVGRNIALDNPTVTIGKP